MKNILIIGAGAAGLSAAASAAQAGAAVTVLEKRRAAQGNGRYAEGVFAAGSRLQKRMNIDASPEKLFKEAMEYSHWRADARLMRRLIDCSGATVDWLESIGTKFTRILHHMPNQCPEVFHMAYPSPTGAHVMRALEDKCRELGVDIFLNACVKSLISGPEGVTGAIAEIDGEMRKFRADAILIATGGFAGNPELMREMIPGCEPSAFMHTRGIPMAGDGLGFAKAVGAGIVKDIAIEGCGPVFGGRGEVTAMIRRSDCLWVNNQGERFCDETICENFIYGQNAIARQPGRMCWAILDEDGLERAYRGLPDMMVNPECEDNGMTGLYEAVAAEIKRGMVYKADTIGELARLAGIGEETLLAETELYNTDCKKGLDSIFGKDRRYMLAVSRAPYYAVRAGMDILTTHGGIRIDSHMRVLTPEGVAIGGLYAAGVDTSGMDSGDYSVMLSGHAFGFSLTGGRIAAQEMTAE